MLSKKKDTTQSSMFFGLKDMLNQKHPIFLEKSKILKSSRLFIMRSQRGIHFATPIILIADIVASRGLQIKHRRTFWF